MNQFAHRILPAHCASEGPLTSLAQVGIEVAVPQIPGPGRKANVRKDLVIWRDGDAVIFDRDYRATEVPIAVMEWKARRREVSSGDVEWLRQFTAIHDNVIGAAIAVDFAPVHLKVVFVVAGSSDEPVTFGPR